jgi:hypothetical protein
VKGSGLEILAGGVRLFAEEFLSFSYRSAFAKLRIILARFASAILESLNFVVYVYEWVCVLLIFHDASPLTRILLWMNMNIWQSLIRHFPEAGF